MTIRLIDVITHINEENKKYLDKWESSNDPFYEAIKKTPEYKKSQREQRIMKFVVRCVKILSISLALLFLLWLVSILTYLLEP